MILKKIITGIFLVSFLTGCVQNTALLGPAYTFGSTGNALLTGLSYGSNKVISNLTGKTTGENLKKISQTKKNDSALQKLLKKQITETRKKLKLANKISR